MQSFVVEELLNSVTVFWLEQERLIAEICTLAREIGEEDENIIKIILFGSLAEGRGVPGSDADILIILKRDDRPFMDRFADWPDKFLLDFPVEIFPFTENELDNPIAIEAMKKGLTVFPSDDEEQILSLAVLDLLANLMLSFDQINVSVELDGSEYPVINIELRSIPESRAASINKTVEWAKSEVQEMYMNKGQFIPL